MDDTQSNSDVHFSLSISTDCEHFFRRTCPSCGRDYKTEIDEADLIWAVAPEIRRVGLEIGEDSEEKGNRNDDYLVCPYCSNAAEASKTLTEELIQYLHRHLIREMFLPEINSLLSGFENNSRRTGGFLSVNVESSCSIKPPRPIHGPEPNDMKIVEFLCCDKKAKISEQWNDVNKCVYCGTDVILI